MSDIQKINVTENDINNFTTLIQMEYPMYHDVKLLAFYRGGLPVGVRISNIQETPLHVIFLQTRDKGNLDYEPIIYPNVNISDELTDLVVIEDIIDSGKTIEKFMKIVEEKYPNIYDVHIFAIVGDSNKMKELKSKFPKITFHVLYQYNNLKNMWFVFPWEQRSSDDKKLVSNVLIDSAKELFQNSLDILEAKNHDYTGGDNISNPFKNFENVERLGIATVEQGILVRLSDKLNRLSGLLVNNVDNKVKDESIHDTISDSINYLAILDAYLKNKNNKG